MIRKIFSFLKQEKTLRNRGQAKGMFNERKIESTPESPMLED
jgi:hypothetical protein